MSIQLRYSAIVLFITLSSAFVASHPSRAMEPPPDGMLERMQREGTLDDAKAFAKSLGTYQLKAPRLGTGAGSATDPQATADDIAAHLGQQVGGKDTSRIASSTQAELDWTRLDLNRDQVIDERDVLALGLEGPKETAAFPSLGTDKTFALLIDFPNYPHYFDASHIDLQMFGDGDGHSELGSLHHYYDVSSGGLLNVTGSIYGWYTAEQNRDYYHPDDSLGYPDQGQKQSKLVEEAILAADAAGADFSQYDNDGDGQIDYFLVVWSGPNGDWSSFWWGYFGVSLPWDFVVDGVHFSSFSWQWEREYYFGSDPPPLDHWDPNVVIHETGHSLGIPDWYDYDGSVGPQGGVGGMDIMGSRTGDHGPFNKYWLGWLSPTLTDHNLLDERLDKATTRDCVLAAPGYDPVAPWAEYYMAQYRPAEGFDITYPASGMLIWHVDSRVNLGGGFLYDNSYTDHKLLKLEQADGLDEIENGTAGGNAGDYFQPGNVFNHASYPTSDLYDGTVTNLSVEDIQNVTDAMTADFILYSSAAPSVDITAPNPGDTVNGTVTVSVNASDDVGIAKLELLIDDELVATTNTGTLDYDWNTLVDFNKPLNIVARAWDTEGQMGSATVGVTVNNAGVTTYTDDFETGLSKWRAINPPLNTRGQKTTWDTRVSPSDPPPPGGSEGWVKPSTSNEWHGCFDLLRGQRINATSFNNPLHVKFMYRTRGTLVLEYSADNGANWTRVGVVPGSYDWKKYNVLIDVPQSAIYLRLTYTGDVREDDSAGWGANIDDLLVREAPSGAPTITITSHNNGDVVSGDAVKFTADASDDAGVAKVDWYVMDGPVATNNAAPWEYVRNTLDDDNHPAVRIKAIAEDTDGLPSLPAEVTVVFRNPRNYPVFDDIEAGTDAWSFQNDGGGPSWQETNSDAFSPTHSIGLLGAWANNDADGVWYSGPPVAVGRRCIDLSGPGVTTPELSFKCNSQVAGGGGLAIYAYTTWGGFNYIGGMGDAPGWNPYNISLESFIGQSVVITWWHWGANPPDGVGLWMDDIRVDNMAPRLDTISTGNILNGDVIKLTGTGFGNTRGTSTVTFANGVVAAAPTDFTKWTNTEIDVRVPNAAETGDVFVTVDDVESNHLVLTLSGFLVSLSGLDPTHLYYVPTDSVPLTVSDYPPGVEKVDLLVDGVVVDTSAVAPFSDLNVDFGHTTNGLHTATVAALRSGYTATSNPLEFNVYSLMGDVDSSGSLDAGDAPALRTLIPISIADSAYRPWYDTNSDGIIREDDLSYIGYHFGSSL